MEVISLVRNPWLATQVKIDEFRKTMTKTYAIVKNVQISDCVNIYGYSGFDFITNIRDLHGQKPDIIQTKILNRYRQTYEDNQMLNPDILSFHYSSKHRFGLPSNDYLFDAWVISYDLLSEDFEDEFHLPIYFHRVQQRKPFLSYFE